MFLRVLHHGLNDFLQNHLQPLQPGDTLGQISWARPVLRVFQPMEPALPATAQQWRQAMDSLTTMQLFNFLMALVYTYVSNYDFFCKS